MLFRSLSAFLAAAVLAIGCNQPPADPSPGMEPLEDNTSTWRGVEALRLRFSLVEEDVAPSFLFFADYPDACAQLQKARVPPDSTVLLIDLSQKDESGEPHPGGDGDYPLSGPGDLYEDLGERFAQGIAYTHEAGCAPAAGPRPLLDGHVEIDEGSGVLRGHLGANEQLVSFRFTAEECVIPGNTFGFACSDAP